MIQVEQSPDVSFTSAPVGGGSFRERERDSAVSYYKPLSGSGSLYKSIHLDHDLDESFEFASKPSFLLKSQPTELSLASSKHAATQTGNSEQSKIGSDEESLGCFSHSSIFLKLILDRSIVFLPLEGKDEFLGNNRDFFCICDEHVKEVSTRWYKSVRKLVKHLRMSTEAAARRVWTTWTHVAPVSLHR